MNEKVYISRDECSDIIFVWRKPSKGNWSPAKVPNCEIVNWLREDMSNDHMDIYLITDFKKKFGSIINKKTRKCVRLPSDLLHNEDYKLISNDPKRKK